MPLPLHLLFVFMLGAALPLALRRSAALHDAFFNWQLLAVGLFTALVVTPVCTGLLRFYPQWSLMYAFDPQLYPAVERQVMLLCAAALLGQSACLLAGYALARFAVVKQRLDLIGVPLLAAALGVGAVLFYGLDRVRAVGDYDAFLLGRARPYLHQPPAVWGALLMLSSCVFLGWTWRRFRHGDPTVL
jgi:hypothetical protein